jgi:hypothetical protein
MRKLMSVAIAVGFLAFALIASPDGHAQSRSAYKEATWTLPWPDQRPRIYGEPCWSAAASKCTWEARRAALRNGNGNGQRRR